MLFPHLNQSPPQGQISGEEEKGNADTGVILDIKDVREMWLTKKEKMLQEDEEESPGGL
jgi:hypothetical protein